MTEVQKRIPQLDIAKGIGIILVVLGHSLPQDSYLRLIIYSFHMPLFFFLSGVTLKIGKPDDKIKDMVRSEFKLLITYLFYTCVFLAFDILVRLCFLHEIGVRSIVWSCYQSAVMFGINVLWFLSSLFIGKIIVRWLIHKYLSAKYYFAFAILFFFAPSIISILLHEPNSEWERLIWYLVMAVLRSFAASSFILSGYLSKAPFKELKQTGSFGKDNLYIWGGGGNALFFQ